MRRGVPPPEIYGAGLPQETNRYPSSITQTSADVAPADANDLKAYLRIVGDSQDGELIATRQAARRLIADSYRVYLYAATLQLRWRQPAREVSLPVTPLISITEVASETTQGEMIYNADAYTEGVGDDGNGNIRFTGIALPSSVVRVTATVGFNPIPENLSLAERIVAAAFYERRAMHNASADIIPPTARAILQQYAPAGARL